MGIVSSLVASGSSSYPTAQKTVFAVGCIGVEACWCQHQAFTEVSRQWGKQCWYKKGLIKDTKKQKQASRIIQEVKCAHCLQVLQEGCLPLSGSGKKPTSHSYTAVLQPMQLGRHRSRRGLAQQQGTEAEEEVPVNRQSSTVTEEIDQIPNSLGEPHLPTNR